MVLRGFSELSGALGVAWGPSGVPHGALRQSLGHPRTLSGQIQGRLGLPWGFLGRSSGAFGGLPGNLRGPSVGPEAGLGTPWAIVGSPSGDLGGIPGSHREASGGSRGDLKIIEKQLVFIAFSAVGAALRDLAAPLGSQSSSWA